MMRPIEGLEAVEGGRGGGSAKTLAPAVAFHDDLAADWDAKYTKAIFQQRAERFLRVISNVEMAGQNWIDAGCGTGTLSRMLASVGAKVVGFDASPQMIEMAKHHSAGLAELRFERIDTIESLPLHDQSIDGVVCSSVIEYLDRPEDAIAEFSRVLRPGGRLLLTVPHQRSFLISIQRVLFWMTSRFTSKPFPGYMVHSRNRYTAHRLKCLMTQHGFVADSIQFTAFWPSVLRSNLFGNMCLYSGTKNGATR